MAGKLLAHLDRCPAPHEQRDKGHAQGVEIAHAAGVVTHGQKLGVAPLAAFLPVARRLDPSGFCPAQVETDHVGCPFGHCGEHRAVRRPPVQPAA
jgi:hypothetical protein